MKLKIRFPEWLLPFPKQNNNLFETSPPAHDKVVNRYIVWLLILWLIIMLFGVLRCSAQTRPLKAGDTIPDITFTNVLNYKSKTLKLSDFKDKVVVLDFWATWCGSCLAKFPAERVLQQKLGDTLQIVLVNSKNSRDTHAKVIAFFKDRKHQYDFPSIDEDTLLARLFPSPANPHYAWVKNNIVVAIPEPEELTASNIRAIYRKVPVAMTSGVKHRADFRKPFLQQSDASGNKVLYYSFIGPYRQDLYPSFNMQEDTAGNIYRIDAVNLSIIDLVQFCTPTDGRRILKRVADPGVIPADGTSLTGRKKYLFTYESFFSPRSRPEALALFRGEIERYFNLRIDTVSKDTTCMVITLSDTNKIVHGKKGIHGETNILDHLNTPVFFRNTSMTAIASQLEDQYKIPVLNNTFFRGRIMIDLPADLNDLNAVSAAFLRQGFRIEKMKRKVTYLLLKGDPNLNQTNQKP